VAHASANGSLPSAKGTALDLSPSSVFSDGLDSGGIDVEFEKELEAFKAFCSRPPPTGTLHVM